MSLLGTARATLRPGAWMRLNVSFKKVLARECACSRFPSLSLARWSCPWPGAIRPGPASAHKAPTSPRPDGLELKPCEVRRARFSPCTSGVASGGMALFASALAFISTEPERLRVMRDSRSMKRASASRRRLHSRSTTRFRGHPGRARGAVKPCRGSRSWDNLSARSRLGTACVAFLGLEPDRGRHSGDSGRRGTTEASSLRRRIAALEYLSQFPYSSTNRADRKPPPAASPFLFRALEEASRMSVSCAEVTGP